MTSPIDISDLFTILHDGTIAAWAGDHALLTLTVECEYLAERIDPAFNTFYLKLFNISHIALNPWTVPIGQPAVIKTDLADIFRAELGILSADIKEDVVVVACDQSDTSFGYCGGVLSIRCQSIQVFDQQNNEITLEQLKQLSEGYWSKWDKGVG